MAVVVLALVAMTALGSTVSSSGSAATRPPASGQPHTLGSKTRLPAGIYEVQLPPPNLGSWGEVRLPAIVDTLAPGGRSTKTFVMPRLQWIRAFLVGDSTARYEFRSPSGNRYVPGETPDSNGFKSFSAGGLAGFQMRGPESGQWTVTTQAFGSKTTAYGIVIDAEDSTAERARLEVMRIGPDPRLRRSPAQPGDRIYVRAFVVKDGRTVPRVHWEVSGLTQADSLMHVPVADDGQHADGAADDGVFVGAFVAEGPDGFYRLGGQARTPSGIEYSAMSEVEVEARNELLIAGEISVTPDHPRVGSPVTMTVTVKSDGTVDNQGLSLKLALVEGGLARTELEESRRTFDLRAGQSRRISTTWTPSAAGDYELQFNLDPYREPFWSDLKNNVRRTTVKVR